MNIKSLVWILLFTIAWASYDQMIGRDLAYYARATYKFNSAKPWSCEFCRNYPMADTDDMRDIKKNLFGYTGYSPKLKAIVVAFRGTYNVENILIDMDYKSIRYPNCPSAYVHRSFYQSMISLKPQLVRNMRVLAKKYSRAKIYFTGHSLGGALAVLSAAEVANLFQIQAVYTYGEPRVGNKVLAKYLDSILDVFRVVNNYDPAPLVPFQKSSIQTLGEKAASAAKSILSGVKKAGSTVVSKFKNFFHFQQTHQISLFYEYWHEGTEIWYLSQEKEYFTCFDEDPECSNSYSLVQSRFSTYHPIMKYINTIKQSISEHWKNL